MLKLLKSGEFKIDGRGRRVAGESLSIPADLRRSRSRCSRGGDPGVLLLPNPKSSPLNFDPSELNALGRGGE